MVKGGEDLWEVLWSTPPQWGPKFICNKKYIAQVEIISFNGFRSANNNLQQCILDL